MPVASLAAVLVLGGGGPSPREWMARSMRSSSGLRVEARVMQRDLHGDGTHRMIRVVRDERGRMCSTVLLPASLAGLVTVDDGKRMRVYMPDQRRVMEQASAMESRTSVETRLKLAERNYRFSEIGATRVAGRDAVVVAADPVDPKMRARRYTLDRATAYPLRLELTEEEGGTRWTAFEVREILFPSKIRSEEFELKTEGPVTVQSFPAPKAIDGKRAETALGFRPLLPRTLPMGFRTMGMHMTMAGETPMLAVRVSDGLVWATVYEVSAAQAGGDGPRGSMKAGGVRLYVGSELPVAHRASLLRAFAGEMKAEVPTPEPTDGCDALNEVTTP